MQVMTKTRPNWMSGTPYCLAIGREQRRQRDHDRHRVHQHAEEQQHDDDDHHEHRRVAREADQMSASDCVTRL